MWILFLAFWGVMYLLCLQNITLACPKYANIRTEYLQYASVNFSCSTATASDPTGPGGPSDAVVIGIPTILVSLLGIIFGAVATVWVAWYTNKKKKDEDDDPSESQLLTHITNM